MQRIVKYYTYSMQQANLQTAAESLHRNDVIGNDTTPMEATPTTHANEINGQPQIALYKKPWNFGPPTYKCKYCCAILWYEERIQKSHNISQPKFTFCCMEGRVQIPLLREPPALLKYLQSSESGKKGIKFMENIRAYNCMFAMTSLGVRVDSTINKTRGPYVFRVSGVNIHFIGSLVPKKGERPKYAQLYIYDTENEVRNRIGIMQKNGPNEAIDEEIVTQLSNMLDETNNHLVKSFRQARDRLQQRLNEGHTLLRSGRLLQQYIVDCYMTIEEERFRWIRLNQEKLRSDLYYGLMDAVHRGDSDCAKVGKSIILPSSHTGGPRTFWKSDCKFIHN
ncbi:hypothetical protein POM88_014168 [Heracleum sosnowskyi]|uniref:Helitron helicase-like domain-containing protein n=1 Tax=Heracleum sosnowskyi TaxID=360622 RepID=A0AAD8J368_9APIA|nr:hypothetical protein POM88_014168 [Heracleum sosnowskyi]